MGRFGLTALVYATKHGHKGVQRNVLKVAASMLVKHGIKLYDVSSMFDLNVIPFVIKNDVIANEGSHQLDLEVCESLLGGMHFNLN